MNYLPSKRFFSVRANRPPQKERPPGRPQRRLRRLVLLPALLLLSVLLAGCSATGTIPQEVCDIYADSIYTARLIGAALVLIAVAMIGFRKQAAAILPSLGSQMGTAAGSVFAGLALLAFSTDIGVRIIGVFGLPDLFSLCGFTP